MNRILKSVSMVALALALNACGSATEGDTAVDVPAVAAPQVSSTVADDSRATAKPSGPVIISYRIIGSPIVGQPVAIELEFASTIGPQPMKISYRVNDATALQLPETQLASVSMAPFEDDERGSQQVTVIPLREGRLYLNVAASIEGENGSVSSVTAIPIQVGGALRETQFNGERSLDENGETVISLPAKEN
jgi:hypothetical protein